MLAEISDQTLLLASLYNYGYRLVDGEVPYFQHPCVCYYRTTLPCTQDVVVHVVELNDPSFEAADAYIEVCVKISRSTKRGEHIFTLTSLIGAGKQIPGPYLVEQSRIRLNPISKGFTSTSVVLGLKGNTGILGQGLLRLYQMFDSTHTPALFYELEAALNHLTMAAIGKHKC